MDHGSAIPPLGYSGILHRAISIEFFLAHYGVLNWMQNPFHLATLLRPNTRHIFGVLSVSHIINLFQLKITLERASDVSCLKTTGVSCAPGQQIQVYQFEYSSLHTWKVIVDFLLQRLLLSLWC